MQKRLSKRIVITLNAELIAGGISYPGVIENISEYGVCLKAAPIKSATNFAPGTKPGLKFQLPSGKTLNLHCMVRWIHTAKTQTEGLINSMGMMILDPPSEFSEFFKSVQ
jgi:hypothetical protein